MGFFEGQRQRNDERIKLIAIEKLRKGEKLESALIVTSKMNLLYLVLGLFPANLYLELTGRGSLGPVFIGLSIAVWFGVFVRQHFLVLTDQRVLAMRLARFSTKKIDDVSGCERSEVQGAGYTKKVINGLLTLKCGDKEQTFEVARVYDERAKDLVRELS